MTLLSWVYVVATAIYATLAVLVIRRDPKSSLNWYCGLFFVSFVFWAEYGIFHHLQPPLPFDQANLAYKIGKTVGGPNWLISFWVFFYLALTNRKKYVGCWPIYVPLIGIPLALSIREWFGPVMGTLVQDPHGYWGVKWELSFWSMLEIVDPVVKSSLGLYLVARFGRHATEKRQRRQALILFCTGVSGVSGACLLDIVWPIWTGNPVPQASQLLGLLWAIGLYISVTRYGLIPFTVQAAADKILATVPDVLLLLDTDGKVLTANDATTDVLGYGRKELVGSSASRLLDQPADFQPLLSQLEREQHLAGLEAMVSARDGRKVPVSITARTMPQADGTVRGSVWVLHDITRQVEMTREIEAANRELSSFAYVVSHDLKAPLRAIDSLVGWLAQDYADKFDSDGKEQVGLLLGRVKRMHNLIDGILQYSRVGRIREELRPVDLSRSLPEVIDLLSPPANIEVKLETPLPTITAEKTRIEQVFQNLLSNAIKYNDKPEGTVCVGCHDDGDKWRFYVKDNGPGIEAKDLERIFLIFQTGKPRDQVESTGVGLAVVKKAVELYGGRVWVESEPGKGSTFFFTYPKRSAGLGQQAIG